MSWLDFAIGVASRAAKKTFSEVRSEYQAGREGRPPPAAAERRAPGPRAVGPAWWEVLGVPKGATIKQATAAYRKLIPQTHPDKVAHLSAAIRRVAEQETRRINAAYEEAQRALGSR